MFRPEQHDSGGAGNYLPQCACVDGHLRSCGAFAIRLFRLLRVMITSALDWTTLLVLHTRYLQYHGLVSRPNMACKDAAAMHCRMAARLLYVQKLETQLFMFV